jgi:hypothetical protein
MVAVPGVVPLVGLAAIQGADVETVQVSAALVLVT